MVKITIDDWDGKEIDTTDADKIRGLLNSVEKEDITLSEENKTAIWNEYKNGTYSADKNLVGLVNEYCRSNNSQIAEDEHSLIREDSNSWQINTGRTKSEKLQFLQSVVHKTRQIIPIAINRKQERPEGGKSKDDCINRKFLCQQMLVKQFAKFMMDKGLETDSNYVHSAVLERIMLLVDKAEKDQ